MGLLYRQKINILFYSALIFFVATVFITATGLKKAQSFGAGQQVGGHFGEIIPAETCGCPDEPPCPHGCTCGMMDATIIPAGVSAPAMCPPPGMPVRTGTPPNPGSTGQALLGTCETLIPTASCSNFGTSFW